VSLKPTNMKNINIKFGFVILLCSTLSSCFTVRETIQFNEFPLANPQQSTKELFQSISDDTVSISVGTKMKKFILKTQNEDGSIIIENDDENYLITDLNKINIKSRAENDTLFLKPSGKEVFVSLRKPLKVQKNRLKAKLKGVDIDIENNKATLILKANIFSIFGENPEKIENSVSTITDILNEVDVKGEIDLVNFTKLLDNKLKKKGDLISRFSKDAYWQGGTKIISASENTIIMQTRLRAEAWTKTKILFGTIKTRLWRHSSNATFKVKINVNMHGKAELEIVDFNFKHFPGEIEQKVKPSINNSLKDFGINLNPKGLRVIFKDLSFKKINSNSVNCSYEFEIEE